MKDNSLIQTALVSIAIGIVLGIALVLVTIIWQLIKWKVIA